MNSDMGIVERKIRHKEEVKAAILQQAWQIVKAEGWQTLSIRKIAEAIEYSIPVIYTHFENKDAILLEFTKEGFQLLTNKLEQAKSIHYNASNQLEAMAQAYWDFAFQQKEFYQLMFGLGIPACDRVKQVLEIQSLTEIFMTVIQDAIDSGNNKEADKWLKFHTYWSILHGLVSIQMMDQNASLDKEKQLILKDAVAGFIKSLLEK